MQQSHLAKHFDCIRNQNGFNGIGGPVLYGYGVSPQAVLMLNTMWCTHGQNRKYIENKEGKRNEFASVIVDNIATKDCARDEDGKHLEEICDVESKADQERKNEYDAIPPAEILASMAGGTVRAKESYSAILPIRDWWPETHCNVPSTSTTNPNRSNIKASQIYKSNPEDVNVRFSYLTSRNGLSNTISPLYLAAYAGPINAMESMALKMASNPSQSSKTSQVKMSASCWMDLDR